MENRGGKVLEKRHNTEKIIPKLISQDGTEKNKHL
jgi:hypothetical protein